MPGTVLLNDEAAHTEDITQNLKHGTGRNAHIVLSPQPSDDPNDPLNWPMWRKELIIAILCLGAMLNAGTNVGPFEMLDRKSDELMKHRAHFSMRRTFR